MKKIEIFSRHCNVSKFSDDRKRLKGFSKETCFKNLKGTIDKNISNITFLMDGETEKHFLKNEKEFEIVNIEGGSQAKSWASALKYVNNKNFSDDQIIYFIEDDYLHLKNWNNIMLEGFELKADYVSLYDHLDKYKLPIYEKLQSKILLGKSCHWRTVPSTTLSFAVKFKTFKKHYEIYKKFNFIETESTKDHEMFIELWKSGSNLISSIPSYASHMDLHWLAPTINWEEIIKKY
tara:strand:- start:17 stop:721 length:705 start_codon:yes stop_codon:yes gene_type:complete